MTTTGFRERGLTAQRLRRLGNRRAKLDIFLHLPPHFSPSPVLFKKLRRLPPSSRRTELREWRESQLNRLLRQQRFARYEVLHRGRDPIGVRTVIPARAVVKLLRSRHAGHITIRSVAGLRPRAVRAKRSAARVRLLGVKVRFALQSEGQRRGLQMVEDRIILLEARSESDAKRRVERRCRSDVFPTMNSDGYFYRWGVQGVLDVCESTDDGWKPSGTEAFYEIRNRRMKRAYEWRL